MANRPPERRQARELLVVALLSRRGHEQRAQVAAAEGAHRRAHRGNRILREHAPVGGEPHHLAAAVERRPVAALRVDGAAVRPVGLAAEARELARLRRRAGGGVVVEGADDVRGRVGVVHRAAVRAPGEAVAHRHVAEDARKAEIAVEAPQRAGGRVAPLVHGADEEAARAVAAAVVEAVVIAGRRAPRRPCASVAAAGPRGTRRRAARGRSRRRARKREAPDRRRHRHGRCSRRSPGRSG